jgi:hypothetical protein
VHSSTEKSIDIGLYKTRIEVSCYCACAVGEDIIPSTNWLMSALKRMCLSMLYQAVMRVLTVHVADNFLQVFQ